MDTCLQSVPVPAQGCVKCACSEVVPGPVDLQGRTTRTLETYTLHRAA